MCRVQFIALHRICEVLLGSGPRRSSHHAIKQFGHCYRLSRIVMCTCAVTAKPT